MDSIIFLTDYSLCKNTQYFDPLKKYTDFKKILVTQKKYKDYNIAFNDYFEEIYEIGNFSEYEYTECEELFKRLLEKETVKFIIAPSELAITTAGYLRTKFGISGMQYNQSLAVRNKWIMKEVVRQRGIKACRSAIAYRTKDLRRFIDTIGFPIIVKPIDGFATINTFKISNEDEVNLYIQKFENMNQPVLLEEFITGAEFHCDSIVSNGKIVFSSVGQYTYSCLDIARNGKPLSSIIYPKQYDNLDFIHNIKKTNAQVIEALGINNSICHAEFFLTENGEVYIGEIGARIGGGTVIPPCIKNSYGVDLFKTSIDLELGAFSLGNIKEYGLCTGLIGLPSFGGIVKSISTEEDFKDTDGLVEMRVFYKKGQQVNDVNDTMTRSGYAIVEDNDYKRLKEKLLEIYYNFKLEVS